jgi:hypothetical protein
MKENIHKTIVSQCDGAEYIGQCVTDYGTFEQSLRGKPWDGFDLNSKAITI